MIKEVETIDLIAIARQTMANFNFYPRIPANVIREVQAFTSLNFGDKSLGFVEDMRDLPWSSIDNSDSKDLDQIEYCERAPNREIRVLVAVADVDAYVVKGSLTDQQAMHNAATVYTGVMTFSMLPERLSHDWSSLKSGEDRLALVIEFFVRHDGRVRPSGIKRAWVKNHAQLIYEQVGHWLDGTGDIPQALKDNKELESQLRLQDEARERLHNERMAKGALELEMIEPRAIVENGVVKNLLQVEKNKARYLIENFMIAANLTMTNFLEHHGQPHIQRVVETPQRWPRIRQIAGEYNYDLPLDPDPLALAQFLAVRRKEDPLRFPDLSLAIVKLLGSGIYVLIEPGQAKVGHFGLAVQDYTHSTAPNRRYVDIVIQRILKSVLAKEHSPYSKQELNQIANWCTERDQETKKVERFMRKVAGAVLLSGRIGEIFKGIVSGASPKGTYVRILHPPVEGRVIMGEQGMDVGSHVRVRLKALEPKKGYIDFQAVRDFNDKKK